MEGILLVNKPQDWTSFDVVAKIRNTLKSLQAPSGRKWKVGHSGTLDPMATGLLPIFIGKATKSIKYFQNANKGYRAEMTLGISTDTFDARGKIVKQLPVSSSQADLERIFDKYLGPQKQIPPMFSAVKVKGKKLYELARRGLEVERKAKDITIYRLDLLDCMTGPRPKVMFEVVCSKGTYVRQLVADIGDDLGCGAHLSKLERIYSHPFHLSQALNLETIITLAKIDKLDTVIISVEEILNGQKAG